MAAVVPPAVLPASAAVSVVPPVPVSLPPPVSILMRPHPGPFTGAALAVLTAAAAPTLPKSAVTPVLILHCFLVKDATIITKLMEE